MSQNKVHCLLQVLYSCPTLTSRASKPLPTSQRTTLTIYLLSGSIHFSRPHVVLTYIGVSHEVWQ